ncbi:MAG: zinc ribbon domain-containing protein, partial [Patescibacteria group bacterium]
AFTGLIRCICGGMVTAEEKYKHQKNGNIHHYIHYHCGHKIKPDCTEKSIRTEELEKQIDSELKKIEIPERFQQWAIKYLHELRTGEAKAQEDTFVMKQRALLRTTQQLDSLMLKFTSPENRDGSLFTTEEYQSLKGPLLKEKARFENELKDQGKQKEEWLELSERTFNFARYARVWFENGDIETKRAIFACIGSDLTLKDKKLFIQMRKPFEIISEGLSHSVNVFDRVGPVGFPMVATQSELSDAEISHWSG